ncbi:MAG: TonB family protein [Rhodocyclales bacterium]|nr:TonB family protein [Rhodocyclales bacterium]
MSTRALPLPDAFFMSMRPPRSRDRRFLAAVVLSILFHGAWLGWLPVLTERNAPAPPPLHVRLAVVPLTPPEAPSASLMPAPAAQKIVPHVAATHPLTASTAASAPAIAIAEPETAAPAAPIAEAAAEPPSAPPRAATQGIDKGEILVAYGQRLAQTIGRYQRYPHVAQVRQWQGTTLLQLHLTASGDLAEVRVISSSGHEILDRQAMSMVREATPLPRLPDAFAGRPLTIDVPVVFRLAG